MRRLYNRGVQETLLQTFSHYPAQPPPVKVRLVTVDEHACSYLPGRLSTSRALCWVSCAETNDGLTPE